eukprot:TRINITY_DN4151_c0_g1_i3.p1 TRINITY_DN4151_c0_g1~~TRINITY_DN4151_c0_g1_i3.p1  ORF type:complete len:2395 (+),score=704.02 TRINITY_DN4151_c0_g1_i3:662-7186(+)
MPGTDLPNIDYTPCNSKRTGEMCDATCKPGFRLNPFKLTCVSDHYNASRGECTANRCLSGPRNAVGPHVKDMSACLTSYSGQQCTPQCRSGYAELSFVLECDDAMSFDAAANTCNPYPCMNGPFSGRDPRAVYTYCEQLKSGEMCTPQCEFGYAPSKEFQLVCVPFPSSALVLYMFDASPATCVPNNCTGGPADQAAEADWSACSALRTGDRCEAAMVTCNAAEDVAVGGFDLICAPDGRYPTTGIKCEFADPCAHGPVPGTEDPLASYSSCLTLYTGQECSPGCPNTHHLDAAFTIQCNPGTRTFNASAGRCKPNPCVGGPVFGHDSKADYSACNALRSNDHCSPTCEQGYTSVNTSGVTSHTGFQLSCVAFRTDNTTQPLYLYDASNVKCQPNVCSRGPVASTADAAGDYSACNLKHTGETCDAAELVCMVGFEAIGGLQQVCAGDDGTGQYSATALQCRPIVCHEGQFVVQHRCVDCPPGMRSVEQAEAMGPDTTCYPHLALWVTDWKPGWHEVMAHAVCDVLNQPEMETLPWQLHPFQISLGTASVHFHRFIGCMVCGLGVVLSVAAVTALLPQSCARSPIFGFQYYLFSVMLPGMSFSASRVFAHSSVLQLVDWMLVVLTAAVAVAEILSLWHHVLKTAVFHARYTAINVDSRFARWAAGKYVWNSSDIGGTFRHRKGMAFCWYSGSARWFLECELAFTISVSGLVGRWQRTVSECARRNWLLCVLALVWCVLVAKLRPMRSHLGNILIISVAAFQLAGLLHMSIGFHLDSEPLYLAANILLVAAAALQYIKNGHDLFILVVEAYHDRRERLSGEREEFTVLSDLLGKRGDVLVEALHKLHAQAGDMNPHFAGTLLEETVDSGHGGGGIAERLSGGLEKVGPTDWTPEQFRSQLCDWQRYGTAEDVCGGSGILSWLEKLPMRWASSFDEKRYFYSQDIVCSGRHVPRQRQGNKVKVCCISFNLRAILRRMLPIVIKNSGDWVALLRSFRPAWPRATDGVASVLIYTYEVLRPNSEGKSRDLQIYAEMNRSMREMGDPVTREELTADRRRRAEKVLQVFCPLITALSRFLDGMKAPCGGMVFRGITIRVAQQYHTGTHFLWGSFSSTSEKSAVARNFMRGAGSLFIVAHRRAVDISWASVFPVEAELILPSNAILTVMSKLPDNLLTLLDTNSDVLVVMEVEEGTHLSAAEAVDLALVATIESSFIYEDFCARYVEPQLGGRVSATRLYGFFDAFLASTDNVLLLTGDGGTGKTSTSLALTARLVSQARDAARAGRESGVASLDTCGRPMPVFVHLPWAAGLLDAGHTGALTRHIQQQMYLDQGAAADGSQLAELQRRPLVLFLDSIDELKGDIELLKRDTLLTRGGILLAEWPETKIVATCRGEFIVQHGLELRHLTPQPQSARQAQMLPFNSDDVRQYVRQVVALELRKFCTATHGAAEGDVQKALADMRTIKLPLGQALALQRSLQGRRELTVSKSALSSMLFERAAGGLRVRKGALPGVPADATLTRANGMEVLSKRDIRIALTHPGDFVVLDTLVPFTDRRAAVQAAMDSKIGCGSVDAVCRATNNVLREFQKASEGLLGIPFVLYMVVSAAPKLESRPPSLVAAEPRCQVYEVWIRTNIHERLPRLPVLGTVVGDPILREEVVVSAAMRVACGMFAAGEWHSTVGRCLGRVDHPDESDEFRRALLGAMPLRVESVDRDGAPLAWRHRTLQEFLIARAVALDTGAQVLGSRCFGGAPVVVNFFRERLRALRQLHPVRAEEITEGLRSAASAASAPRSVGGAGGGPPVRATNAKRLLEEAQDSTILNLSDSGSGPADAIPGSRRVCVGVCVYGVKRGTAPVMRADVYDGGGDLLWSLPSVALEPPTWPELSGGADAGDGDPFFDGAVRVSLPAAPDAVSRVLFTCLCTEGDFLRLTVTDQERDDVLGRGQGRVRAASTSLCELHRSGETWSLQLLLRAAAHGRMAGLGILAGISPELPLGQSAAVPHPVLVARDTDRAQGGLKQRLSLSGRPRRAEAQHSAFGGVGVQNDVELFAPLLSPVGAGGNAPYSPLTPPLLRGQVRREPERPVLRQDRDVAATAATLGPHTPLVDRDDEVVPSARAMLSALPPSLVPDPSGRSSPPSREALLRPVRAASSPLRHSVDSPSRPLLRPAASPASFRASHTHL